MERYKRKYFEKNWITIKFSEIEHVKELQAISYIYNNLKNKNELFSTNDENNNIDETKLKIVIQKILGLLNSNVSIDKISKMIDTNLDFVELISTLYQYGNQNSFVELEEGLRLSDLMKHAGISDLTKKYKDERLSLVGPANKATKLVQMKVNRSRDYITFVFLSEPTYSNNIKITKPPTMKLVKTSANNYTELIRIQDFFKLLKTNPNFKDYKSISIKDIKEVIWNAECSYWCDCASNWYQGFTYYLTQEFDASIFRNDIKPTIWAGKHNSGDGLICKHLSTILSQSKYFSNIMASIIYKYLQKK